MAMMRLLLAFFTLRLSQAFVASRSRQNVKVTSLNMAPRFDKAEQKWFPTKAEEGPEAGYPPVKTLLLHGPKPYFQRVFTPDEYEQAVLKFMAGDKCSRDEAQGNMGEYDTSRIDQLLLSAVIAIKLTTVTFSDAYLRNPNDWAYNRIQEEKRGFKVDYVTLNQKQLFLTLAWAAIVTSVIGRIVFTLATGIGFWDF